MAKKKVISFVREKNNYYITVEDMKKYLDNFDNKLNIIMALDDDGNGFLPLYEGVLGKYDRKTGDAECYDKYSDEAMKEGNALILFPAY